MIQGVYVQQSTIQGKGVFARKPFKRGEVIFVIPGDIVKLKISTPKQSLRFINWIGLGKDVWLNPNKTQARHLNHSCDPNAAILNKRTLVAIKDIKEDEEVTFDYSLTDADPLWKVKCTCGSTKCRGVVGSIHTLSPKFVQEHAKYIPRYFLDAYRRERTTFNVHK